MAKVLYTPVSLLISVFGAVAAGTVFKQIWKRISNEEEAPKALESEYGSREVLPAAALQGAVFALVKAASSVAGRDASSE
jgi:Protein of unknown function (DUF4235)